MGRVAGAYGVRGWLKVVPQGDRQALAAAREWWLGADAYQVSDARLHGGSVVAKLSGVDTPEQARRLKGASVHVRREALPALSEGHFYLGDLVGLEVVNEQGERLGVVMRLFWNGAHDVAEVAGERVRLLPWVSAVVRSVDVRGRRIEVTWGVDW